MVPGRRSGSSIFPTWEHYSNLDTGWLKRLLSPSNKAQTLCSLPVSPVSSQGISPAAHAGPCTPAWEESLTAGGGHNLQRGSWMLGTPPAPLPHFSTIDPWHIPTYIQHGILWEFASTPFHKGVKKSNIMNDKHTIRHWNKSVQKTEGLWLPCS